jgi:hypothetical protein
MTEDFVKVQLVAPTVTASDVRAGGWTVGLRFRPQPSSAWVEYLQRLVNQSGRFHQGSTAIKLSHEGVGLLHVPDERLHDLLNTLEGFVGETNRWYAEEHVDDRQTAAERRDQAARPERTAADVQQQLAERYAP